MNYQSRILIALIFFSGFLNIDSGMVNAFSVDQISGDKVNKLLSLEGPEFTEQYLTVRLKATEPIKYKEAILYKAGRRTPLVAFVDMPDTLSLIRWGSLIQRNVVAPPNLSIDFPVTKVRLAQFRFHPPISRIVFHLKKPIKPIITAEGNSLSFKFPISTAKESRSQREETPAVINQIKTEHEPEVTKLRIISDKQLKFSQVVSPSVPSGVDIDAILEIDILNAISDLPKDIPIQREGVIRKITLEKTKGPPPHCKISVQLSKRVFYDINNKNGELQSPPHRGWEVILTFFMLSRPDERGIENPILDRLVTVKSVNEDLSKLLITLFKLYGVNIVVDKDFVDEQVTFNLENVPLRIALDQILGSRGYEYNEAGGGIIRVSKKSEPSEIPKEPIVNIKEVRFFRLKYYKPASKMKGVLQDLKSPDGNIGVDELTNSIIITDTPESLDVLEKIISELDVEVPKEEKPQEPLLHPKPKPIKRVFKLNYIEPEKLKKILDPLLSEQGNIESIQEITSAGTAAGGGGASRMSLGQGVGLGGYLAVTEMPENIVEIEKIIQELDVPTPQVEIQAHIIEGTLSNKANIGIEWTASDSSHKADFSFRKGTGGSLSGHLLKVGHLSAEEFSIVLNLLSTKSDVRFLSNPKITVLENQQAQFHSGEQVPYTDVFVTPEGFPEQRTIFKDVGILLSVSVQLKADDNISLLVGAQVSEVKEITSAGPTITTQEALTQVLVPAGDTVVIGGLTSDRIIEKVDRVPLLSNIPLLGRLFSSRERSKERREVTLFITPHIVSFE